MARVFPRGVLPMALQVEAEQLSLEQAAVFLELLLTGRTGRAGRECLRSLLDYFA